MLPKKHNYASYKLCRTTDFVAMADALASAWVFRGQADARWTIASSLERETARLKNSDRAGFEAASLKAIKAATTFEEYSRLADNDNFFWLALLQHHGCKTRLVDFTESFYVALYFAVRDLPECDSAVWAINTSPLDARAIAIQDEAHSDLAAEDVPRRLLHNSIEWPDRYKGNDKIAIVYSKPKRLNQRMIAQQGLFLCPLNLERTFVENLTIGLGLTGTKEAPKRLEDLDELQEAAKIEKVIKICISQTEHQNLLFHLRKMNISDATLFPGLDGFARSLNYYAAGMD